MKVICPRCKSEMEDYGDDIWHCNVCSLEITIDGLSGKIVDSTENINEFLDYDEMYETTEDDQPFCCVACGNPAYPDCMDSCKIFDN